MLTEKDREKLSKAKGLRFRVNMACKDCIYDEKAPGNWRKQVQECVVSLRPLYEIRPISQGKK